MTITNARILRLTRKQYKRVRPAIDRMLAAGVTLRLELVASKELL
jgi:hypothetical protein